MLLLTLRKHQKLAEKRNPAFDQNRFAKYFTYFGGAFMLIYLLVIGIILVPMFNDIFPNMEPYHILNQGLIYIFGIGFLFRFGFQKQLAKEIKPYLLLPISRKRLLGTYLLQNLLSGNNLIGLFLFVPFSLLSIYKFYGLTGVLLYCIGMWLLSLLNSLWYLLCRTLLNERTVFLVLPIAFYLLWLAADFGFAGHPLSTFTMNLGEAFILGNPIAFIGVIAAIGVLFCLLYLLQSHFIYTEIARQKDTTVKHISEYRFLERFGEIGEYFRLELKLIFRNKACKNSFRMGIIAILMFSLLINIDIEGESMYSSNTGQSFVLGYCYAVLALMLTQIMSYEGNYLDGLMSRKESIYNLLLAKYYFYCIIALLPFLLLLPAVIRGRITLLASLSYMLLAIGLIYFIMFQLAVYNKRKTPLNESLSGKNNGGNIFQVFVSFTALLLPMLLESILSPLFGTTTTQWIFSGVGLLLVLTSRYWIRNVYRRFMKRRYQNMEGFRS